MLRRILPLSFLFLIAGASTMPFFPGSEALDEVLGAGPQVGGWGLGGNPRPGSPLAFFEFAPQNGAGLGTACGCAAVTGAKGEAVTWTRGSSAMCTKSASESNIANGDLVLCSNNLPRVMSLGGPLGVLVESSRTNDNLWSDNLSNAAYISPLSGVAAVTVTAAFAVGPTGATNATRMQFPATTGVQYSLRAQVAGAAAARTGSIYIKGNGTSGTIDLVWSGVGAQCGACTFNSTTWTRCNFPTASAVNTFEFGNDSADCASAARGAIDVLVAGVQSEAGAYVTSYIPTTTVAVTRSTDTATVPFTTAVPSGSLAVTTNLPGHSADNGYLGICDGTTTGINGLLGYSTAGASNIFLNNAAISGPVSGNATGVSRRSAFWGTGGYSVVNTPGSTGSGVTATTMTGTPASLYLGDYNCGFIGSRTMTGVLSQVCVDPSPSRCR